MGAVCVTISLQQGDIPKTYVSVRKSAAAADAGNNGADGAESDGDAAAADSGRGSAVAGKVVTGANVAFFSICIYHRAGTQKGDQENYTYKFSHFRIPHFIIASIIEMISSLLTEPVRLYWVF